VQRARAWAHAPLLYSGPGSDRENCVVVTISNEPSEKTDIYATEQTFAALGVHEGLVSTLAAQGITAAFPIQAMTINDALAGRDVCGKAKTGSGKTLGFGLPMLQRIAESGGAPKGDGPATPKGLVLLPTRELAVQVFDVLKPLGESIGLRLVSVYGGADIERQIKDVRKGADVIIATPGRLIDLGDRGEVDVSQLDVLVLDEADRMADMGFMPQVEWVLRRIDTRPHQTLLFSATLDGAVDRLVKRYLKDPVFHEVVSESQTVSNMVHHFLNVHQMDRIKVTASICRAFNKSIIFARTKRGADRLVEQLQKEGIDAAAIHGDLRQSQREKALADFTADKLHVLVATDVAARGIHIDGVDCVMHFDPPEDHKAYLHRSGRTARAGATGVVVSLLLWNQIVEAGVVMRRLAMKKPVVEVFSNNPHLQNLAEWEPDMSESVL
jgi:superfamily II DNA/RNA helicase